MKYQALELNFDGTKPDILTGLNDEQKTAVIHRDGPLLIIAGAGTGKTAVITRRIAHIIEQKWAKPSEILALTFTDKAAAEMEMRVDELVPYGYVDTWISTFHAFGDRFLRDYAIDLGLPANFKVLTAIEQAIFMRQNIFAFDLQHYRPIADPLSHINELLTHFSRLKDELISPEEYARYAQDQRSKIKDQKDKEGTQEAEKTEELAKAYARYQELMIQSGNLDFGDQIYLSYKLIKDNQKILGECRKKFKYILVDEFQDTNYAQNELVKLLAGGDGNITVVGDDDQSIYRFRGASISNILDFKKYFKNPAEIVLTRNYRSTQQILDASYKLIQNNNPDRLEIQNKINKKLVGLEQGQDPEVIFCTTLSSEADEAAKTIKNKKEELGLKNNDFAILVRANSQANPFIESLNLAGIPSIFSGASSLFQQPEIKMIIAFLRSLAYTDDNLAFYQLATSDIYNISHKTLSELYTLAKRGNRSLLELSKNLPADAEPQAMQAGNIAKSDDLDILATLVADIEKYREQKNSSAGELLYNYLSDKKYLKKLNQEGSAKAERKIVNIAKFFDRIASFNHASPDKSVLAFLEILELIISVGDEVVSTDIDTEIDAVNILTVHSAKGLEWPVVFIVNCVADRFPSRKRREALPIPLELIKERLPEGDWHLEEERRLFYVAATRAKKLLYLTAAEDYGGKRSKKLSQFVFELTGQFDAEKLKRKISPMEKIERFKAIEKQSFNLNKKFSEKILRLSRQQIDDYYSCPKKFYFAHIIKIPLLENQQLMYGTAIHAALDHYFARKIAGEKLSSEQLLSDYRNAFRNIGFISRDQEELRFKQGMDTLSRFYDEDRADQTTPSKVEEVFEFLEGNVCVKGRFDLIYQDGKSAEIRDFKTTDVREQKDADGRIKKSTQMMIYALAWKNKYGVIPKTTLYFIEPNLKGERTFSETDLSSTKQMISEVEQGIRKNDFTAVPDNFQCKYCPYRDICPDAIGVG
ncbi:MAG: ATP-dependent DNA helicase [Patescibacteria group bacterium]